MTTAEEKIAALSNFRGDVFIGEDGDVLLRSTNPNYNNDVYGPTWDKALERLVKEQVRVKRTIHKSTWFPKPVGV